MTDQEEDFVPFRGGQYAARVMDVARIDDKSLHPELRHVLARVAQVLNFTHERTGGMADLKVELVRLMEFHESLREAVEEVLQTICGPADLGSEGWNVPKRDPWFHARVYAVAAVVAFEHGDHIATMALANDAVFIFGRDGMKVSITRRNAARRAEIAAKGGRSRKRDNGVDLQELAAFHAKFVQRYGKSWGWQKAAATHFAISDAAVSKAWRKVSK